MSGTSVTLIWMVINLSAYVEFMNLSGSLRWRMAVKVVRGGLVVLVLVVGFNSCFTLYVDVKKWDGANWCVDMAGDVFGFSG